MKVLLVRPWVNKNITTVKNFLFGEPLGIECVSTVMKALGHEVLLVDFVGVTSQCTDVENVLKIARLTKAYNEKIIGAVGGVYVKNMFIKRNLRN